MSEFGTHSERERVATEYDLGEDVDGEERKADVFPSYSH